MNDWRSVMLDPSATIRAAIAAIDASSIQIALVVDGEDRLLGTVTDGDVRRAILRGVTLEAPVRDIMYTTPTVAHVGDSRESILAVMRELTLHQVPLLDSQERVVGLETIDSLIREKQQESWVVLMAGGLGTRLAPLTDDTPKPLLTVGNKPILETIIDSLAAHGFRRIYIAVNYRGDMVRRRFGDGAGRGLEIRYLEEDRRLGTAGALSLLPETPTAPVLVMNGDLLTNLNYGHLLAYHAEQNCRATVCVREEATQIPYGVVKVAGERVVSIEEKPVQRHYINAGIYVLDPAAVAMVPKDRFFDMTSLIAALTENDDPVSVFPIREFWMDIGRREDFETANDRFDEMFR